MYLEFKSCLWLQHAYLVFRSILLVLKEKVFHRCSFHYSPKSPRSQKKKGENQSPCPIYCPPPGLHLYGEFRLMYEIVSWPFQHLSSYCYLRVPSSDPITAHVCPFSTSSLVLSSYSVLTCCPRQGVFVFWTPLVSAPCLYSSFYLHSYLKHLFLA